MRQDLFTFTPQFKLLIAGNNLPNLRNIDTAMRRRFRVVPFERTPERPDSDLGAALRREWPGILQWAIKGCLMWQRDGLGTAKVIEAATTQYFSESDQFRQWLDECCIVDAGSGDYYATAGGAVRLMAYVDHAGRRDTRHANGVRAQAAPDGPEKREGAHRDLEGDRAEERLNCRTRSAQLLMFLTILRYLRQLRQFASISHGARAHTRVRV